MFKVKNVKFASHSMGSFSNAATFDVVCCDTEGLRTVNFPLSVCSQFVRSSLSACVSRYELYRFVSLKYTIKYVDSGSCQYMVVGLIPSETDSLLVDKDGCVARGVTHHMVSPVSSWSYDFRDLVREDVWWSVDDTQEVLSFVSHSGRRFDKLEISFSASVEFCSPCVPSEDEELESISKNVVVDEGVPVETPCVVDSDVRHILNGIDGLRKGAGLGVVYVSNASPSHFDYVTPPIHFKMLPLNESVIRVRYAEVALQPLASDSFVRVSSLSTSCSGKFPLSLVFTKMHQVARCLSDVFSVSKYVTYRSNRRKSLRLYAISRPDVDVVIFPTLGFSYAVSRFDGSGCLRSRLDMAIEVLSYVESNVDFSCGRLVLRARDRDQLRQSMAIDLLSRMPNMVKSTKCVELHAVYRVAFGAGGFCPCCQIHF